VAIVSESLARKLWPNEDALGKRLASFAGPNGPAVEVVGVAANTKYANVREEETGLLFLPIYQNYEGVVNLQVRAKGDPRSLAEVLRVEVAALDSNLPLYQVATLPDVIRQGVSGLRIPALVLGLFGPLALILAAVGIYGVMSYSVALQIKEIGVRMALGASRGGVLRMIVGNGLRLAGMGIAIGILGALGATRGVRGMLFGLSSMDPLTYIGVTAMLLLVASIACWVPAWRASRTDPMVALRYE
jgi:predicted lysophospholipase L1 biosynthesis ABC-type transport system permease subunit